jgi:hypothetical protein
MLNFCRIRRSGAFSAFYLQGSLRMDTRTHQELRNEAGPDISCGSQHHMFPYDSVTSQGTSREGFLQRILLSLRHE